VRRTIPESPRWLADHGNFREAEIVTESIEANVERYLKRRGQVLPSPVTAEVKIGPKRCSTTLMELWSKTYRRRTTMVWLLWFFALLGYYGLTTWLSALLQRSGYPVITSVWYTILISLAGIPGFLTASALIDIVGRRPVCIGTLSGGAIAAYLYGTATSQSQLISFGLAMQFCLFGMWSVIYAYTPELYPTHARATGAGMASAVGRLGSLIGPYAVGVILPRVGQSGVFALGATSFLLAALAVLVFGEETKERVLEDLAPTG
jgi:putative MFS transporter